jgi:hypothetical protein
LNHSQPPDAAFGALENSQVAEATDVSQTPSPRVIRIGKVHSLRAARRALVRVTEAVISGQLTPRVANSAIYGLSSITRVLEVEVLERRLSELEERAVAMTGDRARGRTSKPQTFIGNA